MILSCLDFIKTIEHEIKQLAEELKDSPNALYLGRGYGFPVALEDPPAPGLLIPPPPP
jgi:fructoselysine-6-P-deglycase FrlB-like protein